MRLLLSFLILTFAINSPVLAELKIGFFGARNHSEGHRGKQISLNSFRGKIVVVEWFNFGCPYVRKHYANNDMQNLQKEYSSKEVIWLTINSTNDSHQDYQDAQETQKLATKIKISSSHIILDEKGDIGRTFGAKTTPHMFVIDSEGKLVYQGAIDDTPDIDEDPKKAKNYVSEALELAIKGDKILINQTNAYGCSIKYAE